MKELVFFAPNKEKHENLIKEVKKGYSLLQSYQKLYPDEIREFFSQAQKASMTEEMQKRLKEEMGGFLKINVSEESFEDNNFLRGCFYGYISSKYLKRRYWNDVFLGNEDGIEALEKEFLFLEV